MRSLVVSSFHISSTRDVWLKTINGLQANGVDALAYDVMPRLRLFSFLQDKVKKSLKENLPRDWLPTTLAYESILGAALYNDCDWVIVVSPQYFPTEICDLLRKAGLKTAAMFTEAPYEDTIHTPITASKFDVCLINDKHSIGMFESFCPWVEYVPHSYEPGLHEPPENEDEREESIAFIGTGYNTRVKFMEKVDWPARLDLYGWWPWEYLRKKSRLYQYLRTVENALSSWNGNRDRSVTTREQTADIYRKTAASFSIHREMRYYGTDEAIMDGEAYSLGPRNWELAACRTFQVSDHRQELVDVFGDTVPLYQTPAELGGLLRRAFDEPEWRKEMAYRQWEKAQPYSCHNTMRTVAQVLAVA